MRKNYFFVFIFALFLFSYTKGVAQCITPATVPYSENFSALTANNQLPPCWAASNLSVTCLTYTGSVQPGNRAAFYNSPAGVNYFYTGGIQLYTGITYSASVFHVTDNTGSTNWTDLSLLVGSSQSPTGLVSVASTGGPANSSAYTALSNTFAVSSSGIYYIAIRGTSNASGSAPYLYFDDLAITIPCSAGNNSPVLSGSASSSMVCSGQPVTFTISGADTYTWQAGSHNPVYTTTPSIPSGNLTATVMYHVSGTNTLTGCTASVSASTIVNSLPSIGCTSSFTDNTICAGIAITLHAMGSAYNFTWNPSGITTSNASVMPYTSTIYTLSGSGPSNSCVATATIAITVKDSPTVTAQSSATTICAGQSVTLTAQGADSYVWASPPGGNASTQSTIAVSPAAPAVYTVTGTDNISGCSGIYAITQQVDQCQGLRELVNKNKIAVYPNPNNGIFSVVFSESTVNDIEIIDITGRIILREKTTGERMDVSLAGFANGLYYLRLRTSEKTGVIKIVKE